MDIAKSDQNFMFAMLCCLDLEAKQFDDAINYIKKMQGILINTLSIFLQ